MCYSEEHCAGFKYLTTEWKAQPWVERQGYLCDGWEILSEGAMQTPNDTRKQKGGQYGSTSRYSAFAV